MKRLALVCPHVQTGERAVAWAIRNEPVGPMDSGWQFLCTPGEMGDVRAFGTWTIARVVEEEPSLGPHIDSPLGTTLQKEPGLARWHRWR